MKDKLYQHQQELRIKETILSALPAGTDLGVIVAALAELLAENVRLMAKGRKVAGGAPDPLLLQDANVLLSRANLLMMTVARGVAWDKEWEEQASDWVVNFAGWEARHARRGMVTIDQNDVGLAAGAGEGAIGKLVGVTPDGQAIVSLYNG